MNFRHNPGLVGIDCSLIREYVPADVVCSLACKYHFWCYSYSIEIEKILGITAISLKESDLRCSKLASHIIYYLIPHGHVFSAAV
jgi:hypothetical protein